MLKKLSNYAFYLALTIEIFIMILDKSAYIIRNDGQWFRLTFVLFFIKLVLTKYNKREWLTIGAGIVLGVISYLITGRNEIIRFVVFIAAAKDIDYDFMLKYLFYATSLGCLILIILSFFGIGTFSITRDFGRGEVSTRYCLGIGHPNALHCMFWALSSLYLYVYRTQIKWLQLVIIFVANIGMYLLTDSRTGLVTTILTLALFVIGLFGIAEKYKWIIPAVTYASAAFAFFGSALMMSHKFFWTKLRRLDDLLTGRILWTHMDIIPSKTFFWEPFSAKGRTAPTDLGIVKMTYWYGYVPTIIFLIVCCVLVTTALKEGDKAAFMIVVSIVAYSILEGHDISLFIARNYIFFLLGIYWTKMIKSDGEGRYYLIDYFKPTEVIKTKDV